jgi:DNA-binding transcriptional LysR family regulator
VLQYLRYVLAAAEKHSFRQAAIEPGVWESTISRGIRELEDEIGLALFIRHSGGVTSD